MAATEGAPGGLVRDHGHVTGRRSYPVTVRSMDSPKPGWTLEAALDLVRQGYEPEQVERRTGFAARRLAALAAREQRRNVP